MTIAEQSVEAKGGERAALTQAEALARSKAPLRLVADGKDLELPGSLRKVLLLAAHELLRGNSISVVPLGRELTTTQAADILNISRPFLIRLLDRNEIPHRMVGTHRRIAMADVMAYRKSRTAARRAILTRLAFDAQSQELYVD